MEHKQKWRARKGAEIFDFREDALARVLLDDGWEVWELESNEQPRVPCQSGVFQIDIKKQL